MGLEGSNGSGSVEWLWKRGMVGGMWSGWRSVKWLEESEETEGEEGVSREILFDNCD